MTTARRGQRIPLNAQLNKNNNNEAEAAPRRTAPSHTDEISCRLARRLPMVQFSMNVKSITTLVRSKHLNASMPPRGREKKAVGLFSITAARGTTHSAYLQ